MKSRSSLTKLRDEYVTPLHSRPSTPGGTFLPDWQTSYRWEERREAATGLRGESRARGPHATTGRARRDQAAAPMAFFQVGRSPTRFHQAITFGYLVKISLAGVAMQYST